MQDLIAQLVVEGVLDASAAQRARAAIAEGKPLDEAVLAADGIPEEKLLRSLAAIFDIPYIDLDKYELSKEFLAKFPTRLLVQHRLLPLEETDGVVTVATSNLCDTTGLDALRLACGRDCRPVVAPSAEIERCIKRLLGVGAETLQSLTFAAGQTTKSITVVIKGDTKKEADEYFYVLLSGASGNAIISNAYGWGTILNDDGHISRRNKS